jgi:undecaprenyl-diphosphatase
VGYLDAIILGIVEGLTEFLPVSSTGHLILASRLLSITQTDFVKSFSIAIQLGAILAVVVMYFRKLFTDWGTMKRITVAFLPSALVGATLYPLIRRMLESELVVVGALFLGGIIIILFERFGPNHEIETETEQPMTMRQALLVGVAQACAVIPGVSRSGATIIGGLALGLSRTAITEFSFLLAVPTMAAATGYDLWKNASAFSMDDFGVLAVGFVVSFLVAWVAVKSFLRFVRSHSFEVFGWYRMVVALLFFLFVLL